MIFEYYIKRMLRRATCVLGVGSRLGWSASIYNGSADSQTISVGTNSIIKGELLVFPHAGRIAIGDWCYVGEGARIWSAESIEIGNRVMLSHNVNILDSLTHPFSAKLRHRHFRRIATVGHPKSVDLGERPIRICDDAWIATGATVLRGVTVGRGAIIGAGAVVTKDVEPWTVVGGNPARVIRHLDPEYVELP
jgi:acetyltransferase-like isoleucine patch superfamily enzyme